MFFDLNVPVSSPQTTPGLPSASSKKSKGKAAQKGSQPSQPDKPIYTQAQLAAIEARIDLLVHLGYTVLAFTQTIAKKFDPKAHTNAVDALIPLLRPRPGILYLKRLNIILDEDSEKGFGLINAHSNSLISYDILSLTPTTAGSFSLACLTHTLPSTLTTHIISLPLTLPRFNFHLKHTMIRTALKNGAAFELPYVGSLGGQQDTVLSDSGYAESGPSAKRNWWAAAREVVRVTKGKGIIVSGGGVNEADLRAPRDVANLITLLGIPQEAANSALTSTPKSITIRAQTRRTYRAVLSEPKVVIPEGSMDLLRAMLQENEILASTSSDAMNTGGSPPVLPILATQPTEEDSERAHAGVKRPREEGMDISGFETPIIPSDPTALPCNVGGQAQGGSTPGKEQKQGEQVFTPPLKQTPRPSEGSGEGPTKKKRQKKTNRPLERSLGS